MKKHRILKEPLWKRHQQLKKKYLPELIKIGEEETLQELPNIRGAIEHF
jgi:hypothetical protein